jgi:hypothetical protein
VILLLAQLLNKGHRKEKPRLFLETTGKAYKHFTNWHAILTSDTNSLILYGTQQ